MHDIITEKCFFLQIVVFLGGEMMGFYFFCIFFLLKPTGRTGVGHTPEEHD